MALSFGLRYDIPVGSCSGNGEESGTWASVLCVLVKTHPQQGFDV